MNPKKYLKNHIRGWLPKELSLPTHQRIKMVDHIMRLQLLRLVYGVILGALLVTPFGVYHSRSEPYIIGSLWGYHLPIGYVGLLLGLLVVLYPRLSTLRSLKFSSLMIFIGLSLLLSFLFFPKDYFINLLHGTSFSSSQIDVDFSLGNSAVLGLSLLSIIFGLISVFTRYPKKEATDQSEELKPVNPKRYLSRVRGWLPEEPNLRSIKRTMGRHSLVNRRVLILLSVSLTCLVLVVGGVFIFRSWYSEQVLENLKGYVARLEEYDGFTVEPKPLSEFHVDAKHEWYWFGDFRSYAKQENVTHIYIDYEIKGLYYLTPVSPINDGIEANIFYYNKVF